MTLTAKEALRLVIDRMQKEYGDVMPTAEGGTFSEAQIGFRAGLLEGIRLAKEEIRRLR